MIKQLPKSIFDLLELEDFRIRTAMYIGEKKISILKAFIDGYFYAVDTNNISFPELKKLDGFNAWVADYFNSTKSAGWKDIILDECDGDEKNAVNTFFELYDKFMKCQI